MPFLQYPWRWLEAVEAPMAIFFVAAIWPTARRARIAVVAACALLFIAALVYANRNYFQVCYPEDAVPAMLASYHAGAGFDGMFEYSPPNTDISTIARGLPDACLVSDPDAELGKPDPDDSSANPIWALGACAETFAADRPNPEHLRINIVAPRSGWLVLRLLAFPAWKISINGVDKGNVRASQVHTRDDGLIELRVEKGPMNISADWRTTPDVILGRAVSALSILFAIVLGWFERRVAPAASTKTNG
jgi:hypothetical protein